MEKILIFESREEAENTIPFNQIRKVRIKGELFCIAHTDLGFKIFESECPHSGHDLGEGKINALHEIVCSSHAYRFNLQNGECDRPCRNLLLYRTTWIDGQLFAEL